MHENIIINVTCCIAVLIIIDKIIILKFKFLFTLCLEHDCVWVLFITTNMGVETKYNSLRFAYNYENLCTHVNII